MSSHRSTRLPDYAGHSIVNLMQSISTACGSTRAPYRQLEALPAAKLAEARHIVLLVIDGLGQRTLARHPASPNLQGHVIGSMTSVFPSTTASAITTFMTGLAPAQHGLTGWHMHLEEIDQTLAILPLTPRYEPAKLPPQELPPRLFEHQSLFQQLDRECWALAPREISGSPFNAWHSHGARSLAYHSTAEMFSLLSALLLEAGAPRYIYAYYPYLDSYSHSFGTESKQATQELAELDVLFGELQRDVQGTDSWLIATADHGFIDSPPQRVVCLDQHPQLAAMLTRPLCGERRAAYCYVNEDRRLAFESYVRQHLDHCVELHRSSDLIDAGWFGPPPYHPRLASRIGDYTLVMKDDWTIKDWLPGERHYPMLGVHGGISNAEMTVPLIALRV
ncbi:alkaline phosphatase family protein [Propionivibrio sp.]|uniref:alkaline phosphatase family protein n=1 Tax=Propionivibrio sp. TaxID=2212460 RepID=UPI0026014717|nr:alkaline phosphatase family protein [Propionivibrio sp.]MBK7354964.1 alkaline phosphatase family protein [Propionivibrio sp.]